MDPRLPKMSSRFSVTKIFYKISFLSKQIIALQEVAHKQCGKCSSECVCAHFVWVPAGSPVGCETSSVVPFTAFCHPYWREASKTGGGGTKDLKVKQCNNGYFLLHKKLKTTFLLENEKVADKTEVAFDEHFVVHLLISSPGDTPVSSLVWVAWDLCACMCMCLRLLELGNMVFFVFKHKCNLSVSFCWFLTVAERSFIPKLSFF